MSIREVLSSNTFEQQRVTINLIGTDVGDCSVLQTPSKVVTESINQIISGVATHTQLNVGVGGTIITTTGIGNIGIGTTNPSQKFEVVGGEIKAGRVDSNQEGGQVSFGRATDNLTGWYIDVYGNTSTPSLRFVDVSNAAVRLTIDSTGKLIGDGSGLTGIVASSSGVIIRDDGSTVGTAGTIDFGTGLSVSPISAGVVTVTASGGTSSQWVSTAAGIHTLSNVGIGTTDPTSKLTVGAVGASGTSLLVNGDARITGILSVGQGTITLDGNTNTLTVPNLVVTSTSTGVSNLGLVVATTYNMLMP